MPPTSPCHGARTDARARLREQFAATFAWQRVQDTVRPLADGNRSAPTGLGSSWFWANASRGFLPVARPRFGEVVMGADREVCQGHRRHSWRERHQGRDRDLPEA